MGPWDVTITGIITTAAAAVATIIGAVALLKRASAGESRAHQILRRGWDWLEQADLLDRLPPRLRADWAKAIDSHEPTDDDDPQEVAT